MLAKNFSSIRRKYFNDHNAIETLRNFEVLSVKNYLFYHDSLNNYCLDGKISLKRKIAYGLDRLLTTIMMIQFAVLVKYNDDHTLQLISAPYIMPFSLRRIIMLVTFLVMVLIQLIKIYQNIGVLP